MSNDLTCFQGLKGWEIALIVLGVLAFIAIILLIVFCFCAGLFCFSGDRGYSKRKAKREEAARREREVLNITLFSV